MKNKEPAQQIKEYYEQVKHLYPDVSFAQFDLICRSEFKVLKKEIESGNLDSVRLQRIGVFHVRKGRAEGMLRHTELMFRAGKVDDKIRNYIQKIVKSYFKRNYNEDSPLEKTVKL